MKKLKTKRDFIQSLQDGYEDDVAEEMKKEGRIYTGDTYIHPDVELEMEFQKNLSEKDVGLEC